jgi:hypothetical protein
MIRKGMAKSATLRNTWRVQHCLSIYADPKNALEPSVAAGVRKLQEGLGTAYGPLALDPAILTRLDSFVKFARGYIKPGMSPHELRAAFGEKLGYVTYFRGMRLTDSEYKDDLQFGIFSNSLRNGSTELADLGRFAAEGYDALKENHGSSKEEHLSRSPLISVSDDSEMAHMVATHLGNKVDDRKVYLFHIRAPVIDTIRKDWDESYVVEWIPPGDILSSDQVPDFSGAYTPPRHRSH